MTKIFRTRNKYTDVNSAINEPMREKARRMFSAFVCIIEGTIGAKHDGKNVNGAIPFIAVKKQEMHHNVTINIKFP